MQHKLEADGILLEFGTRRILSDIYLSCETGEITGLLGRNGQGKSSLMRVIYGDLEPLSKSVRFDGITVFQAYKRPELLSYLPQFNFIPPHLSPSRVFSDFNLDIAEFLQHFPDYSTSLQTPMSKLSGGQRRLFEVYLIIKSKSQFSLLDEPFSHLMPVQIEHIMILLEEEKARKGFLVTDHLFRYVSKLSDSLYLLRDARIHKLADESDIERLGYARL